MKKCITFEEFKNNYTKEERIVLFLTHKCPVGCSHCSIDSTMNSPGITDFPLFKSLVDGIIEHKKIKAVGITGGEPFVEKEGLLYAVDRLYAADMMLGLYTSGFWASRSIPSWITGVIQKLNVVVLSTDVYHAAQLGREKIVQAGEHIMKNDTLLVLQTVNTDENRELVNSIQLELTGNGTDSRVESVFDPLLPFGRNEGKVEWNYCFDKCNLSEKPTLMYDGSLFPCCQEQIISGDIKNLKKIQVSDYSSLKEGLDTIVSNPLFKMIKDWGFGLTLNHPQFSSIDKEEFNHSCSLCQAMQKHYHK